MIQILDQIFDFRKETHPKIPSVAIQKARTTASI